MSIFIAYPDGRVGKESRDLFIGRFGYVPDIENRNRLQRAGRYNFMITKARDVPMAVENGCDFGFKPGHLAGRLAGVIRDELNALSAKPKGRRTGHSISHQ